MMITDCAFVTAANELQHLETGLLCGDHLCVRTLDGVRPVHDYCHRASCGALHNVVGLRSYKYMQRSAP